MRTTMMSVGTPARSGPRTLCSFLSALLAAATFWATASALAQTSEAVTPGELWAEPSTLTAIGIEWVVTGDENRNAKVEVSYRKAGDQPWKPALPLVRQHGERVGSLEPPRAD